MFENKKIFMLGMARSGYECAKVLALLTKDIVITDLAEQDAIHVAELESLGVKVVICQSNSSQEELFDSDDYEILIKNPGVPRKNGIVQKALNKGIPVLNELEVAYEKFPSDVKIIGITGTNGKTTTTTILYEILKRMSLSVKLGGNIGFPVCSLVSKVNPGDILVLEISDHQLVDVNNFKTDYSILTNIEEAHLDFHMEGFEGYKKAKKKIFNRHNETDMAVINGNDVNVLELTKDITSRVVTFSASSKTDLFLKDKTIYYGDEKIIDFADIKLVGNHNYENIMAAVAIAKEFNVSNEVIKEFLSAFKGVEHRLEYVGEINGRKFYNDSKSTNVTSTNVALKAFDEPTILILGGHDRGHSFDELKNNLGNTKLIVCYGETKQKINDFCSKNAIKCMVVDNLKEATEYAYENSDRGDVILLSPACASWDQYEKMEDRGDEFKRLAGEFLLER